MVVASRVVVRVRGVRVRGVRDGQTLALGRRRESLHVIGSGGGQEGGRGVGLGDQRIAARIAARMTVHWGERFILPFPNDC